MDKQCVTFNSTPNFCELAAESKENYWIIRFLPDGTRVNLRNMAEIAAFPNTKLTRQLEYTSTHTRQLIAEYQATKDEAVRRALWWKIREYVAEY